MDIKIQGITKEIMQVALAQAKEGRMHILGKMTSAVSGANTVLSDYAPRMITIKINPEKIRDVIGKGGSVIRALTEETGTTIDISDDGVVHHRQHQQRGMAEAKKRIENITLEVEVGQVYEGTVLQAAGLRRDREHPAGQGRSCCTSPKSPTSVSRTSTTTEGRPASGRSRSSRRTKRARVAFVGQGVAERRRERRAARRADAAVMR